MPARAPNGDRWSLVRETHTERVFIEHQPNASSGGQMSLIELGDFLAAGRHAPEQQALLRLIGSLVEEKRTPLLEPVEHSSPPER
jgi:hypothetical protein